MHRYPTDLVLPMKEELTDSGFQELLTATDVEKALEKKGTLLVVINSVCGCSAGALRPGVLAALHKSAKRPTFITTAFAGYDLEAVAKVREHLLPYPPSSPSIGLFKDGKLIHFIERHHIEGSDAGTIANALVQLFEENCN